MRRLRAERIGQRQALDVGRDQVPVIGVSSLPLALPSCATGASFTGLTVSVTVAVLEPTVPSLAVKVKLSVPLKFGFGV